MASLQELKQIGESFAPAKAEEIPDIGLYMDQVLGFMKRQHVGFSLEDSGETLTASMINNYVKKQILPRAEGKRYTREHVELLTILCLIKQILSVEECGALLPDLDKPDQVEKLYDAFCETLKEEISISMKKIDEEEDTEAMQMAALKLAVSSYADQMACRMLVEEIRRRNA